MGTIFKPILDTPAWEQMGGVNLAAGTAITAGAGASLASDLRMSQYRNPNFWYLNSAGIFFQYSARSNGFIQFASPGLTGTFGSGANCTFLPSQGPRGLIAAGATTTKFTLAAALPNSATVQANQLVGQRIRIIGNNAAGSGKTEEKTIVANTAGTTPTLTLDSVLTFTPGANSNYEFLTGRVYLMSSGTMAAGTWKYFDIATSTYSGNLSVTNMPGTITADSTFVSLDELYTPITANGVTINGEVGGFFGLLTATASGATTLTGQAAGLDATVAANEYRNFQIRIIEDTATPTAVGQRRRITSHTAGASPVYTVPAWTVTPSANAKYYIEYNNDIILRVSGAAGTYRYNAVSDAWDSTTYGASANSAGNGLTCWCPFNRTIDADKNVNYGTIYQPRGGGTAFIDRLDITAATTGTWTADIAYDNKGLVLWNTGGCSVYDPISNKSINLPLPVTGAVSNMYFFDNNLIALKPYAQVPQISSSVVVGEKLALVIYVDATDKISFVYNLPCSQSMCLRSLIFI